MTTDIKSMFDSIKESLSVEKQSNNSSFRNFLRMEAGKTYLVRLIPNVADPKATFHHYSHHGFTSLSTGQYVDATCPRTYGERCPICELRFKLYKTKKEDDRNLAYNIRPHEKHMVNVYVVSDPTNPENEGTIKILRFGKRIYEKILDATEGDDAEEFGARVYDLSENGCNFKIKVETASEGNRKFINYNNSRFTAPSAIPNMTPDKIKEIYENIFDLSKVVETKSEKELEEIIKTHILCEVPTKQKQEKDDSEVPAKKEVANEPEEEKDEIPMDDKPKKQSSTDEKIKDLLDKLDTL